MCCLENQDPKRIELVKKRRIIFKWEIDKIKTTDELSWNDQVSAKKLDSVMSLEFSPFVCTGYTF